MVDFVLPENEELAPEPWEVCRALGRMVAASLTKMTKTPPKSAGEAEAFVKLVVAYQKALQTALDLEKTLEENAGRRLGEGEVEVVDHDSARREILGRLAELSGEG